MMKNSGAVVSIAGFLSSNEVTKSAPSHEFIWAIDSNGYCWRIPDSLNFSVSQTRKFSFFLVVFHQESGDASVNVDC
jgi:hypothetical protein